ncbi:hypothetical protein ACS0TY_021964 [Phlomoides rotata]
MAIDLHIYLLSLLLVGSLVLLQGVVGVQYIIVNNATNTDGGHRFDAEIGVPYAVKTVGEINKFIWKLYKQDTAAKRKNVPVLHVYITDLQDGAEGETGGDNIYVSSTAIQSYAPGRARFYFTKLMYHETTHIFQWSGQGTAPGGLTEGIADYTVLKSNYFEPEGYTKPGEGNRWDEGYGVTARFLEYCDTLRSGFTPGLNNKMRQVYKDEYFQDFLGKPLDQVWKEYKAKYTHN